MTSTSDNSTAQTQELATRLLATTSIEGINVTPALWHVGLKAALPGTFAALAPHVGSIGTATDEAIGKAFCEEFNSRESFSYLDEQFAGYGKWIRDTWADITAEAAVDAAVEEAELKYPSLDWSAGLSVHTPQLDNLRDWAHNPIDDVKEGVDLQVVYLRSLNTDLTHYWPTDGCDTEAVSKDFMGAVMRFKKARLEKGRLAEPVTPRQVTEDEKVPPGSILLLAPNPKTNTGGNVYFESFTEPIKVTTLAYFDGDRGNIRVTPLPEQGLGELNQSVGRAYLSWPAPDAPVAVETTVEPVVEPALTPNWEALYRAAVVSHEADVKIIEKSFWEEAHNRSWCREAETVIGRLNRELSVPMETDREVYNPECDWTVTGTADCSFTDGEGNRWSSSVSWSLCVEASSEEQATERVDGHMITETINDNLGSLPSIDVVDYDVDSAEQS